MAMVTVICDLVYSTVFNANMARVVCIFARIAHASQYDYIFFKIQIQDLRLTMILVSRYI